MMLHTDALQATNALVNAVPLLGAHPGQADYESALELVEYLLINDPHSPLLEIVCSRISSWENSQPEIKAFREELDGIPAGLAVLRTLIDQYQLTLSDFANEIGSKSMVSRVLSGERQLTLNHIKALASRFNISPAAFI